MSDSPLRRLSVPNKLHLNHYAGVLVPALFKCLHVTSVVCSFVRYGRSIVRFHVSCMYNSFFSSDRDTLGLDMCNAIYDPL